MLPGLVPTWARSNSDSCAKKNACSRLTSPITCFFSSIKKKVGAVIASLTIFSLVIFPPKSEILFYTKYTQVSLVNRLLSFYQDDNCSLLYVY